MLSHGKSLSIKQFYTYGGFAVGNIMGQQTIKLGFQKHIKTKKTSHFFPSKDQQIPINLVLAAAIWHMANRLLKSHYIL